jgi:ferritin
MDVIKIREQVAKGRQEFPLFKAKPLINEKVQAALNTQIKNEMYSSYLYLSMRAWCLERALNGCAHWLGKQAEEEHSHAMKFYSYVDERNGKIVLQAIDAPPVDFSNPLDLFQQVYDHEIIISGMIDSLVVLSMSEKDNTTFQFLQWFVSEQVEELDRAFDIVQRLMIAADDPSGLLLIDAELGGRS